jgi:hypothetical protein
VNFRATLSRFLEGLRQPLVLARATLSDPEARAYYKRVMIVQVAITLALGLGLAVLWTLAMQIAQETPGLDVSFSKAGFRIHTSGDDGPPVPASERWSFDNPVQLALGFGYLAFGALTVVESLVIVLSREYHDQIGRRAALLVGVAPEDPEAKPRVRLNLRWLWTKTKRRMRGGRVFLAGLPVIGLVAPVPVVGSYVYATATFFWSVYWLAVFAGAKSAQAWHDETTATEPFFLRAALRVPILKWYARLWRWLTRALFAPCKRVEETPYELAGVAVVRLIGTVPVLYLFMRPFLPVAAGAIIAKRRALESGRSGVLATASSSTPSGDEQKAEAHDHGDVRHVEDRPMADVQKVDHVAAEDPIQHVPERTA